MRGQLLLLARVCQKPHFGRLALRCARKLKLVIIDSCRDNPLSHKIGLKAGVERHGAGLGHQHVALGLDALKPARHLASGG